MNWKHLGTSVTSALVIFFLWISQGCHGQVGIDKRPDRDTLYVLFERTGNEILEVGKRLYYRPDSFYPKDISRNYAIRMAKLCMDCQQNNRIVNATVLLSHSPRTDTSFLMNRKLFFRKHYVDQDWFNRNSLEHIQDKLKKSLIFLVDPGFVYDDRFIVIQVQYDELNQF